MRQIVFVTLSLVSLIFLSSCVPDRYLTIDPGSYTTGIEIDPNGRLSKSVIQELEIQPDDQVVLFKLADGEEYSLPFERTGKKNWIEGCPSNLFSYRMEVMAGEPQELFIGYHHFEHPTLVRNCPEDPYRLVLRDGARPDSHTACSSRENCIYFVPIDIDPQSSPFSCIEIEYSDQQQSAIYPLSGECLGLHSIQISPATWSVTADGRPVLYDLPGEESVSSLVDSFNQMMLDLGNPVITAGEIAAGTIQISVEDGKRVSSQMGSTGAYSYIHSLILSMTSLPEIDCVYVEIEPGDHAMPGQFCLIK